MKMGLINPLTFLDYDKISDIIMYLSKEVTVKFNVSLASKSQEGQRLHYHQEFEYGSKFNNRSNGYSVRRNFDYYISIDVKNDYESGIMIKPANMIMLRLKLNQVAQWFTKLFVIKDDRLVIVGKFEPIMMNISEYKAIKFLPQVIQFEDGAFKEGVRMILNSEESVYVDLTIDKFMELYYFIDSVDMYNCAIVLLNYFGAPEPGTNMFSMDGGNNRYQNQDPYYDRYEKKEKGNPDNSFFNKMNKKD